MIEYVLLSFLFVVMCVSFKNNRKFSALAKHLHFKEQNAMRSLPIIGISYRFVGSNERRMKAIQELGHLANRYGNGLSGIYFGFRFYIHVTDAEVAELLLKSCLEKDDMYNALQIVLGNGNIVAPVPIWRHRRKILTPTFSRKNLNEMVHIFIKNSETTVEKLQPMIGKGPFSLWPYLTTCSMDSVCESVLGVQIHAQKNPDQPFLKANDEVLEYAIKRMTQPWLHSDIVYKLLPQYKKVMTIKNIAYDFILQILDAKRKEIQAENFDNKPMKTFLEQLMLTSKYSEEELLEESLVLLFAGIDTTAITIGFTMLLLARHQDVQEKVYEELFKVFGNSDRRVTPEDLQSLHYMEAVIKESMRLYPPGPVILRKVTEDVKLLSGVTAVEGCGIMINIWALHRNPKYWGADAEEFRPERFLDTPLKHPAQFIPFSYGPRNCPGFQYAMLSIKTALATILRKCHVLPPTMAHESHKPLRLAIDLLMKDVDNYVIALESRK